MAEFSTLTYGTLYFCNLLCRGQSHCCAAMCKYRLEQPASKIAPSIPWYATPPVADNRVAAAALSVESYQLHLVVMPTRIPSRPLLTPLSRRESPFRRHSQKVWCAATLDCLVLASSSGFVRKRHAGSLSFHHQKTKTRKNK